MSPSFTVKLDVGNITASNRDAVAELREYRSRVSYVVLRDRLRNGGASQPFGEGDTPIRSVLARWPAAVGPAIPRSSIEVRLRGTPLVRRLRTSQSRRDGVLPRPRTTADEPAIAVESEGDLEKNESLA